MNHPLVDAIDQAYVDQHPERDKPFRRHLGGSMIGRDCDRELYYSFRWFQRPSFAGRMLRLFDRGHKEEFRFVAYLRSVGIEVQEYAQCLWFNEITGEYKATDWDVDTSGGMGAFVTVSGEYHVDAAKKKGIELKQWRIEDVMGHFGGSLDGISKAPFDIPILKHEEGRLPVDTGKVIPAGEPFLDEFKTHNTKSFVHLVANGVEKSKPTHYVQMQTYMGKRGLKYGLYMGVNKNDDSLHIQALELDPAVAVESVNRAKKIIHANRMPDRIGKHAAHFQCKFCDYVKPCHYGDMSRVDKNCRTCVNSVPVENGDWHCKKWDAIIPVDSVIKGCDSHQVITD